MNLTPEKRLRFLSITCIATCFIAFLPVIVRGKVVTETKDEEVTMGFVCGHSDPPDACEKRCKAHYGNNAISWKCKRYNTGIPTYGGGSDFLSGYFSSSYLKGLRCICKVQTKIIIEEVQLPQCVNHCRVNIPFEDCKKCCFRYAVDPWSSKEGYCVYQKRNDPTSINCKCKVRKEYKKLGNNRSRNLRSPPQPIRKRIISRK